jgi:hypothetical protein
MRFGVIEDPPGAAAALVNREPRSHKAAKEKPKRGEVEKSKNQQGKIKRDVRGTLRPRHAGTYAAVRRREDESGPINED